MEPAQRELGFLLAEPERRLLRAMAARIPPPIRSNHLTVLGVLGAAGAGAAYALSTFDLAWLWVASGMLVVNWFGDSLDGTLARVRCAERPRYGYYLDHLVDAFATAAIGIGIGLSPYVDLGVALGVVVMYLVLSINVYLESAVFGVFRFAYSRIGPTEVRIILILGNTMLALGTSPRALANWALALVAAGMLGMLVTRFATNLYELSRLEPLKKD